MAIIRLVIDPAADNERATRCVTAVGCQPVVIMRRCERDADGVGWHDGMLMDLLTEELDQPRCDGGLVRPFRLADPDPSLELTGVPHAPRDHQ